MRALLRAWALDMSSSAISRRTSVLIHIVDAASTEGRDPVEDIYKINKELEAYNPEIAASPQVIAANKIDCIFEDGEENPVERLKAEFEPKGIKVFPVSAATGQGIRELLFGIRQLLDESPRRRIVFEQEFFPEDVLITRICLILSQRRRMIRMSLLWKDRRLKKCWAIPIWIRRRALLSSSVS